MKNVPGPVPLERLVNDGAAFLEREMAHRGKIALLSDRRHQHVFRQSVRDKFARFRYDVHLRGIGGLLVVARQSRDRLAVLVDFSDVTCPQ